MGVGEWGHFTQGTAFLCFSCFPVSIQTHTTEVKMKYEEISLYTSCCLFKSYSQVLLTGHNWLKSTAVLGPVKHLQAHTGREGGSVRADVQTFQGHQLGKDTWLHQHLATDNWPGLALGGSTPNKLPTTLGNCTPCSRQCCSIPSPSDFVSKAKQINLA